MERVIILNNMKIVYYDINIRLNSFININIINIHKSHIKKNNYRKLMIE